MRTEELLKKEKLTKEEKKDHLKKVRIIKRMEQGSNILYESCKKRKTIESRMFMGRIYKIFI